MAAERTELLIVGGGPAGLATAIAARGVGLEVVVVDPRRPPIDKACGEGLLPDGVARLRELGVTLPRSVTAPFVGIRYRDDDGNVVAGRFAAGPGLGVRRTHLHATLVRRAEEVGVELRWGCAARRIAPGSDGRWKVDGDGGPIDPEWLVGADGLASRIRRWAGLEGRPGRRLRFGRRRHYRLTPWSELVEVHWSAAGEAYLTPVGPDELGVALLVGRPPDRFDVELARFPALAERLRGAAVTSSERGAGPLHRRVRSVWRPRLALVGDASGYLDAITGDGLSLALHQAGALAAALRDGRLCRYGVAHRRLVRTQDRLTRAALVLSRHPGLRRRLLRGLAAEPALFAQLLDVHARSLLLRELDWPAVARLARRVAGGSPRARRKVGSPPPGDARSRGSARPPHGDATRDR